MSETKRTVEGRECCYCHRNLPITYFPLKPGMKYARYKACRDCHPLGHSCIQKPKPEPKRRTFATDEERKAAKREYQREYQRRRREARSGKAQAEIAEKPAPAEPKKPGRKKQYTAEERKVRNREASRRWNESHRDYIRDYQRVYYRRKKEQAAKDNAEPAPERFCCSMCKRIMTADAFTADGRQYKTCNDCRLKMKIRKATQKD